MSPLRPLSTGGGGGGVFFFIQHWTVFCAYNSDYKEYESGLSFKLCEYFSRNFKLGERQAIKLRINLEKINGLKSTKLKSY